MWRQLIGWKGCEMYISKFQLNANLYFLTPSEVLTPEKDG